MQLLCQLICSDENLKLQVGGSKRRLENIALFVLLTKSYKDNQIKYETCRACSIHWRDDKCIQTFERSLWRLGHRLYNNIKMDPKQIVCDSADSIHLTQDRGIDQHF